MNPETTPLEEENHLPNYQFQVLCQSSGVYRENQKIHLASMKNTTVSVTQPLFFVVGGATNNNSSCKLV